MTMQLLRETADSLHALFTPKGAPEGIHVPHWHGTKDDYLAFEASIKDEKSPHVRRAMRDQLARYIVVSEDDAARHAETLGRLPAAAEALLETLELRGPGVHPVSKQEDAPEVVGRIDEADARRYVVKILRELRQALAHKDDVDLDALALKAALHLCSRSEQEQTEDAPPPAEMVEAIHTALTEEAAAFTAEKAAATEALGPFAVAHEDLGFCDARLQPAIAG